MVAGARAGKTAFLRTLLDTADIAASATAEQLNGVAAFAAGAAGPTVGIRTCSVDVSGVDGAVVRLNVVDTPGVVEAGGASEHVLSELLRFVGDRFAETLAAGGRGIIPDGHVHLCVYMLEPDSIVAPSTALARPALPPSEVAAIQRLSSRVNVLPVVARADTLTSDRLAAVKLAVRRDLADAGIGFGIFDLDDAQPQDAAAPSFLRLPYALFAPDCYGHTDGVGRQVLSRHELLQTFTPTNGRAHGRLVLGKYTRAYRWGHADVLDHTHCDFLPLRHAIFHHRETLQKYTRDYLYDKFVKEVAPVPTLVPRPILTIDAAPVHPPPAAAPFPVSVPPQQQQQQPTQPSAPTPSRAKKITIACNFCRSRKLKCDGARPACHQCQKRAHACDYQAPARGGGTRRKRPSASSGGEAENGEESDPDAEGEVDAESASPVARSAHTPEHEDAHSHTNGNGNGTYYDHAPPATMLAALAASAGGMKSEPVLPSVLEAHRLMPPLPPPHALSLPAPGPTPTQHHALALQHVLHDPASVLPPIREMTASGPAEAGPSSSPGSSPQAGRKRAATTGQGKARTNAGYGPKVVACNHCRARKTKCDGQHPTCASCARRNLSCNYVNDPSQPSRRRATHSAPQAQTPHQPQPIQPQHQSQSAPHMQMDGSPPMSGQGPTPPGLVANGHYANANGHVKRELELDGGDGPEGSPGRGDPKRMRLVNGIA
ncbi:hypothetical protein PENSPDRAFT_749794 [Peniophora sp. CONT]|nr:hypothetical protein PENSPDRAFT_749794 [Peniophora sp. CONT]